MREVLLIVGFFQHSIHAGFTATDVVMATGIAEMAYENTTTPIGQFHGGKVYGSPISHDSWMDPPGPKAIGS